MTVTKVLNAQGQRFSVETVRGLLHRARTEEPTYLTPSTTPGRPGGTLTDYARQLLQADDTKGEA